MKAIKGVLVYQGQGIPDSGEVVGKWYFAPERNWDITRSVFSPGFESQEQAGLAAGKFAERVELKS